MLWVQLVLSPYYLACYIYFYARWFWKFTIRGEEYGLDEKNYVIRRYMKISQGQWDVSTNQVVKGVALCSQHSYGKHAIGKGSVLQLIKYNFIA